MANSNFEVDFIDENDVKGTGDEIDVSGKEDISDAEKEHMIKDIIHKLFIISAFHNHRKALNDRATRLAEATKKPKVRAKEGALS